MDFDFPKSQKCFKSELIVIFKFVFLPNNRLYFFLQSLNLKFLLLVFECSIKSFWFFYAVEWQERS